MTDAASADSPCILDIPAQGIKLGLPSLILTHAQTTKSYSKLSRLVQNFAAATIGLAPAMARVLTHPHLCKPEQVFAQALAAHAHPKFKLNVHLTP